MRLRNWKASLEEESFGASAADTAVTERAVNRTTSPGLVMVGLLRGNGGERVAPTQGRSSARVWRLSRRIGQACSFAPACNKSILASAAPLRGRAKRA